MIVSAIRYYRYKEAKRLIEEGGDVNEKDEYGNTALRWAAALNNLDLTRLLIAYKADIDAYTYSGWTPLHQAVYSGHLRISYLLIKHGANVNTKDIHGITPLRRACVIRDLTVACLLLEYGADPIDHHVCAEALWVLTNKTRLRHLLPRELVFIVHAFLV